VAFDQFVLSGNYAVIIAPKVVKAAREESAELYEVVLKRLKNVAPVLNAETNFMRDSRNGTDVRNGTVLELSTLPLTRRSSMFTNFSALAARMPVLSRDANRAQGEVVISSNISVGSYYLYPAAGGTPVDLSPVKVRYAQPGGQRRAGRANSGKR
jgi:hypothetical protein